MARLDRPPPGGLAPASAGLRAGGPDRLGRRGAGVRSSPWRSLAIIPLAGLIGEATEALADKLGPGIGGLLNATFGNAAELIIALFALFKGLDEVVKASLTGSIIGNLLLVLGASLLAGGLRYPIQRFNQTAAGVGGDPDGPGRRRHGHPGDLPPAGRTLRRIVGRAQPEPRGRRRS